MRHGRSPARPCVGLRFVVALLRNEAFLVERVQASIGLVGQLGACGGLVPHRLGGKDFLGPRPDVDQVAPRIGCRLHRAGLGELARTSGLSSVTSIAPAATAWPSRTASVAMRAEIFGEMLIVRASTWPCSGTGAG